MPNEGFHINPEDKNRIHDPEQARTMAKAGDNLRTRAVRERQLGDRYRYSAIEMDQKAESYEVEAGFQHKLESLEDDELKIELEKAGESLEDLRNRFADHLYGLAGPAGPRPPQIPYSWIMGAQDRVSKIFQEIKKRKNKEKAA